MSFSSFFVKGQDLSESLIGCFLSCGTCCACDDQKSLNIFIWLHQVALSTCLEKGHIGTQACSKCFIVTLLKTVEIHSKDSSFELAFAQLGCLFFI